MTISANPDILPNPIFEGSEKRVEIDFALSAASPKKGLRALSRSQLDELMTLARCTIVSSRSTDCFDAYVLSESSLFVYPTKFVLKTCGTTRLLSSVPRLVEMAGALDMEVERCKYSRASFLFPHLQPAPYQNFDDEVQFLRKHLGHIGNGGSAYVLGDKFQGLQWHMYVVDANPNTAKRPTYSLEVCMSELDNVAAQQWFRNEGFVSAEQTTYKSGVRFLRPDSIIDDYVFEPCGYSMNGLEGSGFWTIHVTPEAGQSYASCELSCYEDGFFDPTRMVAQILNIFKPGKVCVVMSSSVAFGGFSWNGLSSIPGGYGCDSATCQQLSCGARVSFYSLAAVSGKMASQGSPRSPRSVLTYVPSFASCLSDSDLEIIPSPGQGETTSESEDEVLPRKKFRVYHQQSVDRSGGEYARF